MLGQWIALSGQQVAQTFLVYYLTGSPAILGTTALAQGLPQMILLLFGGAFADRFQKKRLLQFGQLGGGLTALIILVGLMTGYLSKDNPGCWWLLILTSVISGICNAMALPARQAMIAEIVSPEKMMNAVGLSTMGQNVCTLLGPTMAGFMIAGLGFKWVYLAMAVLYFVAVVLTNFLPATRTVIRKGSNTFRDVVEGLRYVGHNKTILAVVVFNLLCIFLSMPRLQLMPIFAIDILHVGAGGQGILQSVGAIGSLIAAGAYASLPPHNRGKMMILAGLRPGPGSHGFCFFPLVCTLHRHDGYHGHGSGRSFQYGHGIGSITGRKGISWTLYEYLADGTGFSQPGDFLCGRYCRICRGSLDTGRFRYDPVHGCRFQSYLPDQTAQVGLARTFQECKLSIWQDE